MNPPSTNAHRMLQLFELMRGGRPGPAFELLAQRNLSFSHIRAMHLLACSSSPLAMKDLAAQLHLTPPSVTALVRRLAQAGMVRRQEHAEDSRVSMLSLTAEGRELLDQMYQDHLARMDRLLQGLSLEEQDVFINLLERAIAAMRSAE